MQKQLKKYFPFLFLFLFLFPMAEKQIHAFAHHEDVHCSASEKHFHEPEHNCSLCDFTFTDSNTGAENNFSFVLSSVRFNYNPFNESSDVSTAEMHLPARAPPVV
jgi:hypothetical protein